MSASAIAWFEIPAQDPERAAAFYQKVLGISSGEMQTPQGPVKSVLIGEAPVGAIVPRENDNSSAHGPLIYFATTEIGGALSRVAEAGGQVILPETSIGAFGRIAHILDSEGNRVALHNA